jgi:Protein of unknown function (DUF3987)
MPRNRGLTKAGTPTSQQQRKPPPIAGNARRYSWENPDESLLEDRRGDLPDFPHEVLPPRLVNWLLPATCGAGTLTDHVALPMIGVASSLIGKARRVQASSSWLEPMTLWTCVVAQSGERKTPGFRVVLRALDRIEEENSPKYREAHRAHQLRAEKAKMELKRWRKACQTALNAKPPREPPPMPMDAVEPGDFIYPSLYVQDSTIPRLAKLCEVRPRGMMQIRDELSGLFASMQRQSGARPFYLEAWNGERHVVERVDDKRSITVANLLVGVIGGFQPDKLARAFAGDEDGMYARFLYGWPATPAYAPLSDDIEEVDPLFQSVLTKLIRLPDEAESGQFAPRVVPLSQGARAKFEDYRLWVDRTKRGPEGREQQWLVKSETQVLRLAGTLTFLDWASLDAGSGTMGLERINAGLEPGKIAERFMADAIELMRNYFWPHARAALSGGQASAPAQLCRVERTGQDFRNDEARSFVRMLRRDMRVWVKRPIGWPAVRYGRTLHGSASPARANSASCGISNSDQRALPARRDSETMNRASRRHAPTLGFHLAVEAHAPRRRFLV